MTEKMRVVGKETSQQKSCACLAPGGCLLAVPASLLLLYLLLRGLGAFLIFGDPVKKSDAVVALGGGGEHRVVEAARMIKDQNATWLILTEPGEVNPGEGLGSQIFRMIAVENGISNHAIMVTDGTQGNTHDEAEALMALMKKHKLHSLIVVTDPFHTMRTRIIFHDVFRGSELSVRVHPVPGHWYRSGTWFLSSEGWAHTIREYVKLLGYWTGLYHTLD